MNSIFLNRRGFSLLCFLLLAAFGAAQNLTGTVHNANSGQVLEGAVVMLNGNSTQTDAAGQFSIPCGTLPATISIRLIGFLDYNNTVSDCGAALQVGLSPAENNMSAVTISDSTTKAKSLEVPRAIESLSRNDLQRSTGLSLQDAINLRPGVQMQTRSMFGGQRIIIRGYGGNSVQGLSTNFNGSGYKVYLNGIPITDAAGTTILDDIDNSMLGGVEIIKGPASTMYGNGIAGTILLSSLSPERGKTKIVQEGIAGSYGLWRTNTRLESANDHAAIVLNYGHQSYDGYRTHSASRKDFASFSGDFKNSEKQSTFVYAAYNHSYEQLAGEMDSTLFFQKQNWADPAYVANNAHVEVESFRGGVSHTYRFSKSFSNTFSTFFNTYQLDQASAAGQTNNMFGTFGGRTTFNYAWQGEKIAVNGALGGEFEKTNSFQKSYGLSNGVLGGLRGDLQVGAMQYNTFTQWEVKLPMQIAIVAGVGVNFVEYDIKDRLHNSANPTHLDQSGAKVYPAAIMPHFAVSKIINNHISVYADMSEGYSPTSIGNVIIPYLGEVNKDIKPEKGTQIEVGTKGVLMNSRFTWQVAFFDLNISDKLVPQTVTDSLGHALYTFYTNAGNQKNIGAELAVGYEVIKSKDKFVTSVHPFVTFAYSHFTYDNFKNNNNNNAGTIDYSGKYAIGVPQQTLNAGIDVLLKSGFYLNSTFQYVDRMPLDVANSTYAPSYTLLNAKAGYTHTFKWLELNVFAGSNNLTSSLYYNYVFLNPKPLNPAIPNDYAEYIPGPYKATFYGGVKLGFLIK